MLRRLSTVLVMWFGLLIGVAAPTLACAAAMPARVCCPEGTTSPCGGERVEEFNSLAACCVSVPPAPAAALVDASRNARDQTHDSGSPDPIFALAWLATYSASARPPSSVPAPVSPPRPDAVLIYLRTGRLRL